MVTSDNPQVSPVSLTFTEELSAGIYLIGFKRTFLFRAGQVIGIALFLVAFLRFASRERWIVSILLGICVTAGLHVLFEVILRIPLYQGVIYKYFSGLIGT